MSPKADLPVALGKGTGGENIALDLAKMPHLLIAGATGSGKSVALNAIVAGLLMERSPAEMRMLLVDPKRVELTPYNGIPHLLCPVIVEVDQVVGMLKGVINEMMTRYRQMEEIGVRNIEGRLRCGTVAMPLAQLGRATGIHLILATQRPSVDVVTGLIKANFPSRISFGVTSHIDSRTILDTNGAEKLLGKGDMLYLPRDAARPMRAQGAFISDKEIDRLIDFWQTTPRAWVPNVNLRPVSQDDSEDSDADFSASTDALFDKAVELAHTQKKLSTSLLQRRLRIGYPRAARLMDELEENGVVSAGDGSKSRDVIINSVA
ncbi:DNA translocase FtsK [Geodia barretti]|uniref:DNA translocase FtsK n=1 Tax=Geodia barretti TaxID=519541 RepID=A0AA35SEI4_GEOBA|nr:DNA translocase FtsK [Geodia barretti]